MLEATTTISAATAIRERHDRYSITFANGGDLGASGDNISSELVAQNLRVRGTVERMRFDWRDNRTRDVLMKIGAADATARGSHHDFARAGLLGIADILYSEVASVVKPQRSHYIARSRP
jgi:hypothetical protein